MPGFVWGESDPVFAAALAGDERHVEVLRFATAIAARCVSVRALGDVAEDVAQIVALAFAEKEPPPDHPDRWTAAAVRKLVAMHIRNEKVRRRYRRRWTAENVSPAMSTSFGLEAEAQLEADDFFAYCTATLKPAERRVFMMVREQELTYNEAAAALDVSRETVHVHMVRASAKVRQRARQQMESGRMS